MGVLVEAVVGRRQVGEHVDDVVRADAGGDVGHDEHVAGLEAGGDAGEQGVDAGAALAEAHLEHRLDLAEKVARERGAQLGARLGPGAVDAHGAEAAGGGEAVDGVVGARAPPPRRRRGVAAAGQERDAEGCEQQADGRLQHALPGHDGVENSGPAPILRVWGEKKITPLADGRGRWRRWGPEVRRFRVDISCSDVPGERENEGGPEGEGGGRWKARPRCASMPVRPGH